MKRRTARDIAFKLIYEADIVQTSPNEVLDIYFRENENVERDEYIDICVCGVFENLEQIDGLISGSLKNWRLERVSKVSLAIMRLCVYEMLFIENIPEVISINEAIELAKIYDDGENAGRFVNGVVNNVKEMLEQK